MDSLKKELHILQWHDSIVHKHLFLYTSEMDGVWAEQFDFLELLSKHVNCLSKISYLWDSSLHIINDLFI